jgi:phenylpropionate dioxygenase-like ring-hydroxylating dioxygenase large terminal subunit
MERFPLNAWYVACYGSDVGSGLLPRTVLGQDVVLWRCADGSLAAVEDRCIHRRISLSKGRLHGDHVQCGYHGLEFDKSGLCRHIPGQVRIPAAARVRAYPIVEKDGFVWLWPGASEPATPETIPDYSVASSPGFAGKPFSVHVQANALLCIENALDLSHVAFAHLSTVGNDFIGEVSPVTSVSGETVYVRREMRDVPNAPLYRRIMGIDRADRTQEVRFWPAGNLALHTTVKPAGSSGNTGMCTIVAIGPVTPETSTSHYQHLAMYRDFALEDNRLSELIAEQFLHTVREDMALIEDQQRNLLRDGDSAVTVDIAVDAGPLAARRLLRAVTELEVVSVPQRASSEG